MTADTTEYRESVGAFGKNFVSLWFVVERGVAVLKLISKFGQCTTA
jgi:hypothetical protein